MGRLSHGRSQGRNNLMGKLGIPRRERGEWQRVASLTLNVRAALSKLVARSASSTYRVVLDGPGTAPDAVAVATALVLDPGASHS
jgi:hypothetical protein